jgi:hypothetical protein
MTEERKIYFVTGNKNKLKEVNAILGESIPLASFNIDCKYFTRFWTNAISTRVSRRTRRHLKREVQIGCTAGIEGRELLISRLTVQ